MTNSSILDRLVRVEVLDRPIIAGRSGVKNGNAWTIPPAQLCAIWQDGPFAVQVEVPVPESGPFKPGLYFLGGEPLVAGAVNDGGGAARIRIKFNDRAVDLVPVAEVAAALAEPAKLKAAS